MQGPIKAKTISVAAAAAVLLAAGCGDEPQTAPTVTVAAPSTTSTAAPTTTTTSTGTVEPPQADEPTSPAETATEDPRVNQPERAAELTVRRYVEGLAARDGAAVCALLAPGVVGQIELPEQRGDCAASLEASVGYRDPRGLPVWDSATVPNVRVTEIDAGSATVVATVVTHFADRDEASVEDDVVYLIRARDRWLIAKPSSTLYRAVGIADVPPSVLAPPG